MDFNIDFDMFTLNDEYGETHTLVKFQGEFLTEWTPDEAALFFRHLNQFLSFRGVHQMERSE